MARVRVVSWLGLGYSTIRARTKSMAKRILGLGLSWIILSTYPGIQVFWDLCCMVSQ